VDEDTAPVATPPAHDPFADGHLDPVRNLAVVVVVVVVAVVVAVVVIVVEVVVEPPLRFVIPTWRDRVWVVRQGDEECDKCDSHRFVGVGLLVFAMLLFMCGVAGVLRGFQASATVKDNTGILNPMLRGTDEESGGLYQTYTPGFHENGSVRVESSAGDGRANRYMTPELLAQVKSKPKAPDERAAAADSMKEEGNKAYQEAVAMPRGASGRTPSLMAAAETYQFALTKLGNVDDPKRDATQVVPVWTACHLNLAALYLEVGEPAKAEQHATEVVDHESAFRLLPVASFKAHYRRGLARLSLGKAEEAAEDLVCARTHSPGDRKLHALCAETMRKVGKEDFFGVYKVVAAHGAQVKEGVNKGSKFVATLKHGEMVSVLDAKTNEAGQLRLHVLPWKVGDVRGWTSLETENGVRILERTEIDFWKDGEISSQSWQEYLAEAKVKVNQGLNAAQVASAAPREFQEQAKAKALQTLEAAREARKQLADRGKTRYRAVQPAVIRQGVDASSEKVGNLMADQEVVVLEEQGNRVRIAQGWVSKTSAKGTELLTLVTDHSLLPADTVQEYARILFVGRLCSTLSIPFRRGGSTLQYLVTNVGA
jgi:hypothetical protein